MITRHHIVLTLFLFLIPCTVLPRGEFMLILCVLIGTGTGAILPDIHMKRPAKNSFLTIAWIIMLIGRKTVIAVFCTLYRSVPGIRVNTSDKRITHSVSGMVLYGICCTIPALAANLLVPDHPVSTNLTAFSTGILLGMGAHLVQDLCTRKGITPLFPFSDLIVHGTIRPCNVYDPRIPRFHVQHLSGMLLCHVVLVVTDMPGHLALLWGIGCSLFITMGMIWQSGVRCDRHCGIPSSGESGLIH